MARIGFGKVLPAALCVALAAGVALAGNNVTGPDGGSLPAVAAGSGTIDDAVGTTYDSYAQRIDFTITVTGDTDDTGTGMDQVSFQVWDDGILKASKTYEIPVGDTQTITDFVTWTGPILEDSPCVGIVLNDDPGSFNLLDFRDPFCMTEAAGIPALGTAGIGVLVLLIAGFGAWFALRRS